jgi:hypothetical protein
LSELEMVRVATEGTKQSPNASAENDGFWMGT